MSVLQCWCARLKHCFSRGVAGEDCPACVSVGGGEKMRHGVKCTQIWRLCWLRCAANETSIPKAAPGGRKEGREAGDKGRNTQGLTSTLQGAEALDRGTI